jgi:hypothetical protein
VRISEVVDPAVSSRAAHCALGHGTDPEAGAPLMSIEKASGIWHREQVQWDPVKPLFCDNPLLPVVFS